VNTIAKLRESGILTKNLVVLPNTSNTCLANNGTHISMGSARLGALMQGGGDLRPGEEKYLGDLTIKIVEHFCPSSSAPTAPRPLAHGFRGTSTPRRPWASCPTNSTTTNLRMIWRRWKKKARAQGLRPA
jgi:hypothetical protein